MLKYKRFFEGTQTFFSKIDVGEIVGKENVSLTKDQWSEIPIIFGRSQNSCSFFIVLGKFVSDL